MAASSEADIANMRIYRPDGRLWKMLVVQRRSDICTDICR
jgi:hypothetical protein